MVAEAEEQFGDLETVERLFEVQGEPIADALVEGGYLSPGEEPTVESVVSRHEFSGSDATDVATVGLARRDGTDVVDVRIRQRTGDAEIEYHVRPGLERGHAVVDFDDSDAGVAVFPDGTEHQVSTSSCCPTNCDCGDIQCTSDTCDCDQDALYYWEEILCCDDLGGYCDCYWETWECDCPNSNYACT